MSTDPTKPSAEERAVNIAIELGWNEMTNNSEQRAYDLILAQIRAAEADAREPLEQKLKKQSDFFQERIGELGREVERLRKELALSDEMISHLDEKVDRLAYPPGDDDAQQG